MFHLVNIIKASNIFVRKPSGESIRTVCNRLHIKGLPASLNLREIYQFVSDYGRVLEIAAYHEMQDALPPDTNKSIQVLSQENDRTAHNLESTANSYINQTRKQKMIYHNRPAGQTAIVTFFSTNSAIACKEELHWRPFPRNSRSLVAMSLREDQLPIVNKTQVYSTIPRDRPLLNVHFETNFMYQRLRGWVKRDLDVSRSKISDWEKTRETLVR